MAEKLSVQIALEGGAEIERQLADIGQAGQKAFVDISKSAEQIGGFNKLDPKDVTAKLQEMGVTGTDSIKKIQDAVQSVGRLETLVQGITSVESALSTLAGAAPIVGAAIVAAFAAATTAVMAFANAVNKVSDNAAQLGVSIEKLDQFRAGLEQAGVSAEGVSSILQNIKSNADRISLDQVKRDAAELQRALAGGFGGGDAFKRLTEAADQFTPAGKAAREELLKMNQAIPGIGEGLQRIGDPVPGIVVTMKDVRELGVELAKLKSLGIDIKVNDDAITRGQKIIEFLAKMPDQAKAAQIAMQQFGPAGAELVAAFRTGTIGIDQFKERLGTMTTEQEAAANKIRQSSSQLSADWERFKTNIGAPIAIAGLAALTSVFEAIKDGVATTVREFVALGTAINAVATVGAGVIAAMAAPIQLVISAVQQFGSLLAGITWESISGAGAAAWNAIVSAVQGAGSAINDFISSLAGITWDAISSAGVAAWNAIVSAVQGTGSAINDFISSLAGITWDAISSVGVAAWNTLTGAINGAATAVANFFSNLASGAWDKVKALLGLGGGTPAPAAAGGGQFAGGGLLGGRGSGTSDSNLAWVSRGEHIMPAAVVRRPGVLSFLEALRRSGRIPGFAEGGTVLGEGESVVFTRTGSSVVFPIVERILQLMQTLIHQADSFATQLRDLADTYVTNTRATVDEIINISNSILKLRVTGAARGGLLGGRGSGTSDSNLAWVSRGEYITPARAVRQPGVLAFLEALRRSGGNLSRVLDGMGRFALGGMVPRMMPAFAGGGLGGGGNHVTIQFPGLPAIGGLRASSEVVDELRKAAAMAQVRSGGRKPSRYS